MTMPMEYVEASKDFEAFMVDFMEISGLPTHHRGYHSIRAVLHVFRSHLEMADALKFAGILPPVLRAIFVEDWEPEGNPLPFPDRKQLYAEVKHVRCDHNLAPESVISDAAKALRRNVDSQNFDRILADFPVAAQEFWKA